MRYIYLAPVKTAADKKAAKALPRMTQAELARLIKDRVETKVVAPGRAARMAERRAAQEKAQLAELAASLKGRKTVLNELLKRRAAQAAASTAARPPTRKQARTGQRFMLQSVQALLEDAHRIGAMRQNPAVCARHLDALKSVLEKQLRPLSITLRRRVDKLAQVDGLAPAAIAARQAELMLIWRDHLLASLATDADLTRPGPEAGEGEKSDQSGGESCASDAANPKGLITRHRWPLKRHITSVKQQGARGTCSAFGTVAAVEAAVSVKYGQKLNLSEQDLYKKQRLDWNPNPFDRYDEDGYFPLASMLFQLLTGYRFALERDWAYNPSWSRRPEGTDGPWTLSCVDYNGLACSDTNHQAQRHRYTVRTTELKEVVSEVCEFTDSIPLLNIAGGWVCERVSDWIEVVDETVLTVYETNVPGSSRCKVTQWVPVWDPVWDNDIGAARLLLSARVPLIFCFTVPDSWEDTAQTGPNGRGYIVHNPGEKLPDDAGGHCVALVGHIDNADIPAAWGLEPGAGGGYFIVKNSWGVCWADKGYAYAPYDWVRKWGTSILAITQVERV
jgi:Papain family cysteine protease